MANRKISELPTKNTPAAGDFVPLVDTSGQIYVTKKATLSSLVSGLELVVLSNLDAYLARDGAQTAGGAFTFSNSVTFSGTVGGSGLSSYVTGKRLDEFAAPTTNVGMNNQRLTGLANPVDAADAVTKAYVDATKQVLDFKDSVRVATTANITLSGLQTIDDIPLIVGDRVLVKNQNTASNNGIYVAASGAWSRAPDANTVEKVSAGMYVFVSEGSTQADSAWVLASNDDTTSANGLPGVVLGISALNFVQFSGAGQITAGAGLTKTGNTIDVETASANRIVINSNNIDLATTGVAAGVYGGITVDEYGRVTAATNNLFGNGAVGSVVRVGANGQLSISDTISATNLPTTGVSAGTYTSVTVDVYGRVTAASNPVVVAAGKTLTVSNTMTLTAADSASVNLGAGGTVVYENSIIDGGAY